MSVPIALTREINVDFDQTTSSSLELLYIAHIIVNSYRRSYMVSLKLLHIMLLSLS
jgi:hypothetical protein